MGRKPSIEPTTSRLLDFRNVVRSATQNSRSLLSNDIEYTEV